MELFLWWWFALGVMLIVGPWVLLLWLTRNKR